MSTVPRSTYSPAGATAGLHGTANEIRPDSLPVCSELEEMKRELAKTMRAYLEQDERAKGTFPSFDEARQASDLAETLAQRLFELRLRLSSHRELHGCG
jgi:hypothetical protein